MIHASGTNLDCNSILILLGLQAEAQVVSIHPQSNYIVDLVGYPSERERESINNIEKEIFFSHLCCTHMPSLLHASVPSLMCEQRRKITNEISIVIED